jgi:hypothetical protein
MNLTWVSRHPLAADQIADLRRHLGLCDDEPLTITTENVVWEATENWVADSEKNRVTWERLAGAAQENGRLHNRLPIVTGVFPPVALEARTGIYTHVLTPVSRQAPELRVGEGPVPFVHVRWATI